MAGPGNHCTVPVVSAHFRSLRTRTTQGHSLQLLRDHYKRLHNLPRGRSTCVKYCTFASTAISCPFQPCNLQDLTQYCCHLSAVFHFHSHGLSQSLVLVASLSLPRPPCRRRHLFPAEKGRRHTLLRCGLRPALPVHGNM